MIPRVPATAAKVGNAPLGTFSQQSHCLIQRQPVAVRSEMSPPRGRRTTAQTDQQA